MNAELIRRCVRAMTETGETGLKAASAGSGRLRGQTEKIDNSFLCWG